MLLAVDLGLRCGLAGYARDGVLCWYRSTNFGSATRLRRAVPTILAGLPELEQVVLEGGGVIAEIWQKEAFKRKVPVLTISAERWRRELLLQRQQRTGTDAKQAALDLARQIIEQGRAPRATSLRHDAAEAILIGWFGVRQLGWGETLR